jgi:iron complex outermembrane receptor protein/outer membrane receptor for ferrienterochelin and colicins
MHKVILFFAVLLATQAAFAQGGGSVKVTVKNKDTRQNVPEASASVRNSEISGMTNADGVAVLENIPDGEHIIEVSALGYESAELKLNFPLAAGVEPIVYIAVNNEVGEVTIESTRTGREIEAEPTRVEAIDEEEVDEKINMRPANVSMVLNESTGIQVQQTSATTNTQTIRIQGLDGRYTQILKDGFPAFGGFSGSLSVLEIPPLDLRQVEVIKGPSATLFGGDAIAGVVNFITKDPEEKPVTTLLFNQTSALGTDFSVFNSRKFSRIGYTLLASANYQKAYDVDDDDFTELPRTHAFAFTPKLLFYIDDKTNLVVGNSTSVQKRKGGDVFVLRGRADGLHQYFEQNDSVRNITTINFNRETSGGGRLFAKQSFAFFDRELATPGYAFGGNQFNSYTDVSYAQLFGKHAIVFGGSAVHDRFREDRFGASTVARDETRTTFGGYIQDTVDITPRFSIEAGFRLDHARDFGTFALPRVSILYRLSDDLTTRIGYGLGYKTPTMFTEDAEELLFRSVFAVGDTLKAERSQGGTFDINYRKSMGDKLSFSINQMFFYTEITDPLVLTPDAGGIYRFSNSDARVISRGFETNARVTYGIAKLFVGYTFTDAKAGYLSGDRRLPLLPRSRVNSSLVFEQHENFKTGVEFYYGSRQILDDRSRTRAFAEVGLFAEKTFGKFSIFVNAENLTDVRQSRYSTVVFPPHQAPSFADLYTHTEGRIFNGGVKIRL